VPVVDPAGIVMVVEESVRSAVKAAALEAFLSIVTVTSFEEIALEVAVIVEVPAASATVALFLESVTVGALSSSRIVIVTDCVPDSVPFITEAMSMIAVSSTSSRASWTAVNVAVPVVWPAGILIVVEESVKSEVSVAELEAFLSIVTVTSIEEMALEVAVMTEVAAASATFTLFLERETVGAVSSSRIVIVLSPPVKLALSAEDIEMITVSLASYRRSFNPVKVTAFEVVP
jgi:hypothetical protein